MITPEHVQLMARYNHWQNGSVYSAAARLDAAELERDRGAFFGSILATLAHILWADQIWMSRFTPQISRPEGGIATSTLAPGGLEGLMQRRAAMDAAILHWAAELEAGELAATLSWFSGAIGADVQRPTWLCVTHVFNHQTHHRGQVHAMLTATGVRPDDTDLFLMPDL